VDTCERIILHVVAQISVGALKWQNKILQSRGLPTACLSLGRSASAEQVLQEGCQSLFRTNANDAEFYLGNSKGERISALIDGIPWTLEEYLLKHGIAPSKCKFCIVKVTESKEARYEKVVNKEQQAGASSAVRGEKVKDNCHLLVGHEAQMSILQMHKRIGSGTFGNVYLGTYGGTPVAIKRINISGTKEREVALQEVKALMHLRHPNIVLLMGYHITDDLVLIIMNYIPSGSLHDIIHVKKQPPLLTDDKISIAEQCCYGLQFMHSQQPPFVHRDLKPGNILVEVPSLRTYLCDMGLTRVRQGTSLLCQATAAGTPMYIAPEAFAKEFGTPSDVWAFGIIFIEMMAECYSWGELLDMFGVFAAFQAQRMPPSLAMLDVPLQDVAKACLKYKPEDRASITEVIQLLYKAQDAIDKGTHEH
jgi:hypothetical protein